MGCDMFHNLHIIAFDATSSRTKKKSVHCDLLFAIFWPKVLFLDLKKIKCVKVPSSVALLSHSWCTITIEKSICSVTIRMEDVIEIQ